MTRAFDGIHRHRPSRRPVRTLEEPPPTPPTRRGGASTSGALLVLLLTGGAFLFLRPERPAIDTTAESFTVGSEDAPAVDPATSFRAPQGGGLDTSLDQLVVLESPTDTSAPQEDSPSTGSDTDETTGKQENSSIRILNGSGKAGAAAAVRDQLDDTFTVISIGNAQTDYARTTLYYQAGKRTAAENAVAALSGPTPILEESELASPADVLIVLGADR